MQIDTIKKVTMSCPACRTGGIILDITPKDDAGSQDILAASESFVCPVCKEKFGGARKLLESVNVYNEAAKSLNVYQAAFAVRLN